MTIASAITIERLMIDSQPFEESSNGFKESEDFRLHSVHGVANGLRSVKNIPSCILYGASPSLEILPTNECLTDRR